LGEVAGAMQMLDLPQPAHYLAGISAYTERELIGRARVPSGRQLDTVADALASLEYYLEALREQRPNRDGILDVARNSLEALGYWPVPEAAVAAAGVPETPVEPGMDAGAGAGAWDLVEAEPHAAAGGDADAAAPVESTPTIPEAPAEAAPPAQAEAPVGSGTAGEIGRAAGRDGVERQVGGA